MISNLGPLFRIVFTLGSNFLSTELGKGVVKNLALSISTVSIRLSVTLHFSQR